MVGYSETGRGIGQTLPEKNPTEMTYLGDILMLARFFNGQSSTLVNKALKSGSNCVEAIGTAANSALNAAGTRERIETTKQEFDKTGKSVIFDTTTYQKVSNGVMSINHKIYR